jgi:hypothetical protein
VAGGRARSDSPGGAKQSDGGVTEILPSLENLPTTPGQWNSWSFDHKDSHDRIRQAIFAQYGVNLSDYQVDPIDPTAPTLFLQNNSQLHSDMNGVLGLQSADLQDVNLGDQRQFEAWLRLHWQEHTYAESKLRI